jgi:hypothetical protein
MSRRACSACGLATRLYRMPRSVPSVHIAIFSVIPTASFVIPTEVEGPLVPHQPTSPAQTRQRRLPVGTRLAQLPARAWKPT